MDNINYCGVHHFVFSNRIDENVVERQAEIVAMSLNILYEIEWTPMCTKQMLRVVPWGLYHVLEKIFFRFFFAQ